VRSNVRGTGARDLTAALREDVDIAPAPSTALALAQGSLAGMTRAEQRLVTARLREGDEA